MLRRSAAEIPQFTLLPEPGETAGKHVGSVIGQPRWEIWSLKERLVAGHWGICGLLVLHLQWLYLLVATGLFLAAEHQGLPEPGTRENVS